MGKEPLRFTRLCLCLALVVVVNTAPSETRDPLFTHFSLTVLLQFKGIVSSDSGWFFFSFFLFFITIITFQNLNSIHDRSQTGKSNKKRRCDNIQTLFMTCRVDFHKDVLNEKNCSFLSPSSSLMLPPCSSPSPSPLLKDETLGYIMAPLLVLWFWRRDRGFCFLLVQGLFGFIHPENHRSLQL